MHERLCAGVRVGEHALVYVCACVCVCVCVACVEEGTLAGI